MGCQRITYLDNASTTYPKPRIVHDTVRDFYIDNGVNPGRTGCEMAVRAEKMVNETRELYSTFFNQSLLEAGGKKDRNRLVFTMNATMSLNLIINGIVGPADHVVTTKLEHNSVIRPINHKVLEGAESTYVAPDSNGVIDPEDIRKAIRKNTTLVVVNHASNVTGVVQDIKAIGQVCKEEGVPLAIDSAQTAGVLPIDMYDCNISFLSFTGHKALFGPTGTGGICVADDAEIRSTIYGGTGILSPYPYQVEEFPHRLEAGTINLSGIAGLNCGLKWIMDKGLDSIYAHEMELAGQLLDGFASIPGVKVWGPPSTENRVATISITMENHVPRDIGSFLDKEYGIQTRPGLHCAPLIHEHQGTSPDGTVRFSIGAFNTKEDIALALKALDVIASK